MPEKYPLGTRFGRLKLIARFYEDGVGWMWLDCDCGEMNVRARANHIYSGKTQSCGCYRKEVTGAKERPKGHKTHGVILSYYKRNAKVRGVGWHLTREEFDQLIHDYCYYCGDEPVWHLIGGKLLRHNGIDRLDSYSAYDWSNVVPCCKWCNIGKNILTPDLYIEHARKVAAKWNTNE